MKKFVLCTIIILIYNSFGFSQESHLSLTYDFIGEDFDHSVIAMVSTDDSLYIIKNTPNGLGILFRMDENGEGFETIWSFDDVNYAPSSLIANDTLIFGTTRFSSNGGGTLFKYSLKDYSFEFIKDFDNVTEVQEIQIKYITDSLLWFTSQTSFVDLGSIFTTLPDGSGFEKIYNDTDIEKGQNPADFIFHNDSIYIAFYNGGGIPYPDGTGSFSASGSVVRIKKDGTGYEKLIEGGDHVGTQPQSLLIREDKIIGLFAYSGSSTKYGGQFFRCNLDGSAYDSLGALSGRSLGKMLSTDSLIYGISASNIFGVNPFDGEIRIFDDILENPDFGWDIVSTPVFFKGNIFLSAQQKGPDESGGTIIKWTNQKPEINPIAESSRTSQDSKTINLNELFTDPEGDSLTFEFEYDNEVLSIDLTNGILTLTTSSENANITIVANDGWTGYTTTTLNLDFTEEEEQVLNVPENNDEFVFYPNPTNSILKLKFKPDGPIDIIAMDGRLIQTFSSPGNQIDLQNIKNGIYLIRYHLGKKTYLSKLIKQ